MSRRDELIEARLTARLDLIRADLRQTLARRPEKPRVYKRSAPTASGEGLADLMTDLLNESRKVSRAQNLLESLKYEYMEARRSAVARSHAQTFDWIFEEAEKLRESKGISLEFAEWLRTGNGIFWVSGKAGSGKSTLMKYLCSHYRTLALLQRWAGDGKLVVATHFFWNAGTTMQKSQAGE